MYDATDGLVTPLIGQVISDAGYDASYSLNSKPVIARARKWDDVMSYEHPTLTVLEPVMLDFGAIGKGYAIDMVGRLMKENGFENFVVNAGGDILCRSTKVHDAANMGAKEMNSRSSLRIGLEHPNNPQQVIGVAEISNQSICGSAGNRRAWGEFHHIINPATATSPKHISALWVVTDASIKNPTALADALTTGLFFVEPNVLARRLCMEFEYLIIYADNTINKSKNFPAEIFE